MPPGIRVKGRYLAVKTVMHLALLGSLLGVTTADARAQQKNGSVPLCGPPSADTAFEDETVQKLIEIWQEDENETVRREAARTLQQMGTELVPSLGCALARALHEAKTRPEECARQLATIQLLAGILGRNR